MTEFRIDTHKTYNGRYMYLSCTQQQDVQRNTSIIHWTLTVTDGTSNYYTTGPTTVTIGGKQVYYSPIVYYNAPKFPASKGSVSGTVEIPHRTDGTMTIECAIETAIYDGVLRTAKGSWDLDAIPRASTVLATDSYIGSTCVVLVDRKSSQYTHTIGFCAPGLEGFLQSDGTLSQEPVKLEATTIPFQVPMYLYDRIPNDRKLECTLICDTYLGELPIGSTQSCTFQALCREEDCAPFIICGVTDCNEKTLNLTGDANVLVRFFSRAKCEMDAYGMCGATISQKSVNGIQMEENVLEIPHVETGAFTFLATDSRGFLADAVVEQQLLTYRKLTANYTLQRQDATSDRVELTVFGDYWPGNFGKEANSLTATCRVGEREIPLSIAYGEDSYTATATIEGLAYDKTSYLTVEVADALMAHSLLISVKPGVPVFDWGEEDFAFHVPVVLSDGSPAISRNDLMVLLAELGLIEGGTI